MSTLDAAVVSYLLSQQAQKSEAGLVHAAPPQIAPHEYVLVYYPQEPVALGRRSLAQRLHEWFPGQNFDIAFPDQEGAHSALAVLHPDGYLMLQALILQGYQVDFDLTQMAQFGFAPVLARQLDVLRLLRQLSKIISQPDWQAGLQSGLSGGY